MRVPWKEYTVPAGSAALACVITVLAGPARTSLALRAHGEVTGREGCVVKCSGTATFPVVGYRPTDIHFAGPPSAVQDIIVPEATVVQELMPPLISNHGALLALLNCTGPKALEILKAKIYPGSVLATNMGPSMFGYARGTAQLGVKQDRLGRPTAVLLIQTRTAGAEKGPLDKSAEGNLQHELKAEPDGVKTTSFGGLYMIASSDSVIRDYLKDGKFINVLKMILQAILLLIPGGGIAGEGAAELLNSVLSAGAVLEQSVEYSFHASLKENTMRGGTKSSINLVVDDKGKILAREVNRGKFAAFALHDPLDRLSETVVISTRNRSQAKAQGVRADGVSALGNMWAYVTLLCCHDEDGGQDPKLSFAFDNAFFDLKELNEPQSQDRLPRLKEHQIKSGKFIKDFSESVNSAGKILEVEGDCKKVKKMLQDLHVRLKEIIDKLEEKQDP